MELKLLMKSARSAVLELSDGGIYYTKEPYRVFLGEREWVRTDTVVTSLFGLSPDTEYVVRILTESGEETADLTFSTDPEFVTLNVREFGAKGDGVSDDTEFLQAAICACPAGSRVLVPAGTYRIRSLFLKSGLRMELAKGATLAADPDRTHYPVFPGLIQSYDETEEYNLGTWEGNPLPMFAGIITGLYVEDVILYGEGCIDGCATKENWWRDPKKKNIAFRPRLVFLSHCNKVTLQGLTCKNSPAWTLHPYFSTDLGFYSLTVENPSDSPNTDGLDPESCSDVVIEGVRFSLGDDCIAVKSGKIYMGRKFRQPSENILIRQCLMENGHGAVTIGSEMAGGVRNLKVEECIFRCTDRGLRIKTRRGRGKDAVLDDISFWRIDMDHVMTPFVVNAFYFCDPDGKTHYVQSREEMPVDERTPEIRRLAFEEIKASNCHVAAAFFDGLPERKIEEIIMRDVEVSFAQDAVSGVPAMSEGVEPCKKRGLFARNVAKLTLKNVQITGAQGETFELTGVDEIVQD
ncbi:MAG: glycoside hydrolase family 28 protein [Lachnospiraceae bacterium]|nr:glycoside hydrolase family 28 protein [Lachnospiraceae bacterium]